MADDGATTLAHVLNYPNPFTTNNQWLSVNSYRLIPNDDSYFSDKPH